MTRKTWPVGVVAVLVGCLVGCTRAPRPTGGPTGGGKSGAEPTRTVAPAKAPHARAAQAAVDFLLACQNDDGGWGSFKGRPHSSVGVTALVAYSLMRSPAKPTESSSPELAKAMAYIVEHQNASGAISDPALGMDNYTTSAGVMALKLTGNPAYRSHIKKAKAYLLGIQLDEGEGVGADNAFAGGAPYKPGRPGGDASPPGLWVAALHALATARNPAARRATSRRTAR